MYLKLNITNDIFFFFKFRHRSKKISKMSVKLDFQCSYCNIILKNPIHLPCFCDTICAEHLKDSNVLKEKCIKCNRCKEVFPLNESDFKSNRIVSNLLTKEIYLSDKEKNLKSTLEAKLKVFYDRVEQLEQNKNVSVTESHNHFQEIRRKLDLQREELKEKIDKIYFEMIDETKEKEKLYASRIESLNYKTTLNCQGEVQTLEKEIQNVNETFRYLNVSLYSIKRMIGERNAAIIEIVSKLSQLNDITKYLKLDKEEFGRLDLNDYFSKNFDAYLKNDDEDENVDKDEDENEDKDEDDDDEEDDYEDEEDALIEDKIFLNSTV
jgi:hypothetical protein